MFTPENAAARDFASVLILHMRHSKAANTQIWAT